MILSINKPINRLVILFKSFWRAYFVILSNGWFRWNNFWLWILLLRDIKHEINLILKVFAYLLVIFLIEIDLYQSIWLRLWFIIELMILNILIFRIKCRRIIILIIITVNRGIKFIILIQAFLQWTSYLSIIPII